MKILLGETSHRCRNLYKLFLERLALNILMRFYHPRAICVLAIDRLKQLIFRNVNIFLLYPISRTGRENR